MIKEWKGAFYYFVDIIGGAPELQNISFFKLFQ